LFYHTPWIPEFRNAGSERDSLKCHWRNARLPSKKQNGRETFPRNCFRNTFPCGCQMEPNNSSFLFSFVFYSLYTGFGNRASSRLPRLRNPCRPHSAPLTPSCRSRCHNFREIALKRPIERASRSYILERPIKPSPNGSEILSGTRNQHGDLKSISHQVRVPHLGVAEPNLAEAAHMRLGNCSEPDSGTVLRVRLLLHGKGLKLFNLNK